MDKEDKEKEVELKGDEVIVEIVNEVKVVGEVNVVLLINE